MLAANADGTAEPNNEKAKANERERDDGATASAAAPPQGGGEAAAKLVAAALAGGGGANAKGNTGKNATAGTGGVTASNLVQSEGRQAGEVGDNVVWTYVTAFGSWRL